jgi:hypothetical protein
MDRRRVPFLLEATQHAAEVSQIPVRACSHAKHAVAHQVQHHQAIYISCAQL